MLERRPRIALQIRFAIDSFTKPLKIPIVLHLLLRRRVWRAYPDPQPTNRHAVATAACAHPAPAPSGDLFR